MTNIIITYVRNNYVTLIGLLTTKKIIFLNKLSKGFLQNSRSSSTSLLLSSNLLVFFLTCLTLLSFTSRSLMPTYMLIRTKALLFCAEHEIIIPISIKLYKNELAGEMFLLLYYLFDTPGFEYNHD